MNNHILVWDLETVPDLPCVARVHGFDEDDHGACREALGDKFPKLPFHKIACIGALIAERREGVWTVLSLGAPHIAERTEAEMIQSFVDRIGEFRPQMITFNGSSFDLPVLRYRAMINRVSAPGLECRRYWYRYTDDCLDLCRLTLMLRRRQQGRAERDDPGAWLPGQALRHGWIRGGSLRPGGAARGSGWLL